MSFITSDTFNFSVNGNSCWMFAKSPTPKIITADYKLDTDWEALLCKFAAPVTHWIDNVKCIPSVTAFVHSLSVGSIKRHSFCTTANVQTKTKLTVAVLATHSGNSKLKEVTWLPFLRAMFLYGQKCNFTQIFRSNCRQHLHKRKVYRRANGSCLHQQSLLAVRRRKN